MLDTHANTQTLENIKHTHCCTGPSIKVRCMKKQQNKRLSNREREGESEREWERERKQERVGAKVLSAKQKKRIIELKHKQKRRVCEREGKRAGDGERVGDIES